MNINTIKSILLQSINGKKWEKFHSGKVACLAYARIQGKAALIAHFQESSLMNEDTCCHPILFTTDGPNAGNQVTNNIPHNCTWSYYSIIHVIYFKFHWSRYPNCVTFDAYEIEVAVWDYGRVRLHVKTQYGFGINNRL